MTQGRKARLNIKYKNSVVPARRYIGYIELVTLVSTMHSSMFLWQPGHSSSSPSFISAPQCMHAVHDETFSSAIARERTGFLYIISSKTYSGEVQGAFAAWLCDEYMFYKENQWSGVLCVNYGADGILCGDDERVDGSSI